MYIYMEAVNIYKLYIYIIDHIYIQIINGMMSYNQIISGQTLLSLIDNNKINMTSKTGNKQKENPAGCTKR